MGIETERLRVDGDRHGRRLRRSRRRATTEYPLLLVAARRLGAPSQVDIERERESSSPITRRAITCSAASWRSTAKGRFTAMRVRVDWRHGAYFTSRNVWVMVHYLPRRSAAISHSRAATWRLGGVYSNTNAAGGVSRDRAHRGELPHREPDRGGGAERPADRRDRAATAETSWTIASCRGKRRAARCVTRARSRKTSTCAKELVDWSGFRARRAERQRRRGLAARVRTGDVRRERRQHARPSTPRSRLRGEGRVIVCVRHSGLRAWDTIRSSRRSPRRCWACRSNASRWCSETRIAWLAARARTDRAPRAWAAAPSWPARES